MASAKDGPPPGSPESGLLRPETGFQDAADSSISDEAHTEQESSSEAGPSSRASCTRVATECNNAGQARTGQQNPSQARPSRSAAGTKHAADGNRDGLVDAEQADASEAEPPLPERGAHDAAGSDNGGRAHAVQGVPQHTGLSDPAACKQQAAEDSNDGSAGSEQARTSEASDEEPVMHDPLLYPFVSTLPGPVTAEAVLVPAGHRTEATSGVSASIEDHDGISSRLTGAFENGSPVEDAAAYGHLLTETVPSGPAGDYSASAGRGPPAEYAAVYRHSASPATATAPFAPAAAATASQQGSTASRSTIGGVNGCMGLSEGESATSDLCQLLEKLRLNNPPLAETVHALLVPGSVGDSVSDTLPLGARAQGPSSPAAAPLSRDSPWQPLCTAAPGDDVRTQLPTGLKENAPPASSRGCKAGSEGAHGSDQVPNLGAQTHKPTGSNHPASGPHLSASEAAKGPSEPGHEAGNELKHCSMGQSGEHSWDMQEVLPVRSSPTSSQETNIDERTEYAPAGDTSSAGNGDEDGRDESECRRATSACSTQDFASVGLDPACTTISDADHDISLAQQLSASIQQRPMLPPQQLIQQNRAMSMQRSDCSHSQRPGLQDGAITAGSVRCKSQQEQGQSGHGAAHEPPGVTDALSQDDPELPGQDATSSRGDSSRSSPGEHTSPTSQAEADVCQYRQKAPVHAASMYQAQPHAGHGICEAGGLPAPVQSTDSLTAGLATPIQQGINLGGRDTVTGRSAAACPMHDVQDSTDGRPAQQQSQVSSLGHSRTGTTGLVQAQRWQATGPAAAAAAAAAGNQLSDVEGGRSSSNPGRLKSDEGSLHVQKLLGNTSPPEQMSKRDNIPEGIEGANDMSEPALDDQVGSGAGKVTPEEKPDGQEETCTQQIPSKPQRISDSIPASAPQDLLGFIPEREFGAQQTGGPIGQTYCEDLLHLDYGWSCMPI